MKKTIPNILLGLTGPSDSFILKYGLFTFRLKIKPLTLRQLIAISKELSHIKSIDENKKVFPTLMENISDAQFIAIAIAIATGTRFKRIVSRAISRLDLKDIQTLFSIVVKQSDPSPFFLTCLQAGRMNLMKEQEPQ